MAVTLFTKKELDNIIKSIISATLPRMGIVSTFPREMIFAPKKKQGLNIHYPFYW